MQRVIFTIICFGLAVAAPQRSQTEVKDSPEEMLIRLVLHVKRSDDGTQLMVDLEKSQESSSVVRPKPQSIVSMSTTLPIFAKNKPSELKEANETQLLVEKSYEIPKTQDLQKTTESSPYVVFSQTKRSIASDSSNRAAANGYINLRPQTTWTTPTNQHNKNQESHVSSPNEHFKPKDIPSVVRTPATSRPKLDFKITIGGMTTERPHIFNPSFVVPIRETPTTTKMTTTEVPRTTTPVAPSKPPYYYHYDYKNTTESQEEMPEIELIDKAVADQGFGVLASRCESFAPGLVSDGAGGCTRPVARPKNKNYQGTYAYRSASGNELHADVKEVAEEAENTTENSQESHVRVV